MNKAIVKHLEREILICEKERIVSVPYHEITRIVCDKPYVEIETKAGKKCHLAQSFKGVCDGLPPVFVKCNKSTYVNLIHGTALEKSNAGYELCIKKVRCSVSKSRVKPVSELFLKVKEEMKTAESCRVCGICEIPV